MSSPSGSVPKSDRYPDSGPRLDWELEPWSSSLAGNFAACFRRSLPVLWPRPAAFWPDVLVHRPLPWKNLARSYVYHAVLVGLVYLISLPFYRHRFFVELAYPKPGEAITYYADISPYVPPAITRSARAKAPAKASPRRAPLTIESVPVRHDNREQTVVAPNVPRIVTHNMALPNMVVMAPMIAPAPPVAATMNAKPRLVFAPLEPIAPPPSVTAASAASHLPALPQVTPVQPPAAAGRRDLSKLALPDWKEIVVNPEPKLPVASMARLSSLPGAAEPVAAAPNTATNNLAAAGRALPGVAEPIAPTPQTSGLARPLAGLPGVAQPVAPPPSTQAIGPMGRASGALIALGLNPTPGAPPKVEGNRRGLFATSPAGSPDATGTPEIRAGGAGPGGDARPGKENALGLKLSSGGPADVTGLGSSAGSPTPGTANGTVPRSPSPFDAPSARQTMMAKAVPPPDLPRPAVIEGPPPDHVDQSVFGGRKYYTMLLNTPNLTSTSGSWIFRFAELDLRTKSGQLTAPVALAKVDPAYPADLMRDGVEGVVICYAVIRSDGTVGDVKILEGFDSRLDENARRALSRWHFRPGTRNGAPVDLEMVVRIPFRAGHRGGF
jgi:TonB family protein